MNMLFRLLFGGNGSGTPPVNNHTSCGNLEIEGFDPGTKLTFEETMSQMSRGYENTQRVIQFMDAKAGAVIALSLAVFAFVGKVVAWAYEKTDPASLAGLPWCVKVLGGVAGVGVLIAGFGCLDRAFATVRPNGLPIKKSFNTLFPALEKAWENPHAIGYFDKLLSGESRGFALGECKDQLLAVGGIVFSKIRWLRHSIRWLWVQGLCAVVLGGLISCGALCGWLEKSDPAKTKVSVGAHP